MPMALEKCFDALVSDVQAMQKELILAKMSKVRHLHRRRGSWDALAQKVAAAWDNVPAVDEIAAQREKQW
ncbi:MAG: hypothetical protein A2091_01885 [Desulfuromonadales bacterium GWD2_61_12]|nr:MAG: hypothetical protein A2005_06070 [Desulfuromonadales bacterium GWC2_61_20]OGR35731.1 MAG: hypothetical protein A2091_01885 [Desulfuromonadales bacterium GWD2_61_12]HAD04404.1 hypothetical protein [Desulfuromonas sp.]